VGSSVGMPVGMGVGLGLGFSVGPVANLTVRENPKSPSPSRMLSSLPSPSTIRSSYLPSELRSFHFVESVLNEPQKKREARIFVLDQAYLE
jgi:hypothetical protein